NLRVGDAAQCATRPLHLRGWRVVSSDMGPRPSGTSAPSPSRQRLNRLSSWPVAQAPSRAASRRARITQGRSVLSEVTVRREPSERDMRRKRPAALAFLLRVATARRIARVISLLALDFAGVALAI